MMDFQSQKTSDLQLALDECLMALQYIAESEYRLDVDAKTKRVWYVWRGCQEMAEEVHKKHSKLALKTTTKKS